MNGFRKFLNLEKPKRRGLYTFGVSRIDPVQLAFSIVSFIETELLRMNLDVANRVLYV